MTAQITYTMCSISVICHAAKLQKFLEYEISCTKVQGFNHFLDNKWERHIVDLA